MPFEHRIDRCFGDGTIDRTTFETLRRRTAPGIASLVAAQRDNSVPLLNLPGGLGARVLDHDPKVGGRYSVLSLVGLLPALVAGLDAGAIRRGAATVWDRLVAQTVDAPPAQGAALAAAAASAGLSQTVLMPY